MAYDINKPLEIAPGVSPSPKDMPGNDRFGFGQNLSGSTAVGREKGNRDLNPGPQSAPAGGVPFKRVRKG